MTDHAKRDRRRCPWSNKWASNCDLKVDGPEHAAHIKWHTDRLIAMGEVEVAGTNARGERILRFPQEA